MKWFGSKQRTDFSPPYDDDLGFDPSEPDLYPDHEDEIVDMRGTIVSGDCIICGAKNGMKYVDDVCFVCSECGQSVDEWTYYRWAVGEEIEFEDDEYDDIY